MAKCIKLHLRNGWKFYPSPKLKWAMQRAILKTKHSNPIQFKDVVINTYKLRSGSGEKSLFSVIKPLWLHKNRKFFTYSENITTVVTVSDLSRGCQGGCPFIGQWHAGMHRAERTLHLFKTNAVEKLQDATRESTTASSVDSLHLWVWTNVWSWHIQKPHTAGEFSRPLHWVTRFH